jgi:signal transduction histidine kinase
VSYAAAAGAGANGFAMSPSPIAPSDLAALTARLTALETLQRIARELTAELDLERLLEKILGAAMQVSQSTAGTLFLYDAETDELVFRVVVGGGGPALKNTRFKSDQGIAGESFTFQRAVVVDNAETDARYFSGPASSVGIKIHQLVAVPLLRQGRAIGVLEVMNKTAGGSYLADDVDLLLAFAAQSAVAIENARLYGQVRQERDRILNVEAAVRHELARDLHDGPTQLLSALIMTVRHLRELTERNPDQARTEFLQLEALAQKALYQTRNILFDLRPIILEQRGLGPALEQYVVRLRMVEPLHIRLEAGELHSRLDPQVEAAVFSIVQEAVNNAKKHAHAANLWITAIEEPGQLRLTVRDDGRGFDVQEIQSHYGQRGSLGLLNMKERAQIARAELQIDSQPGQGTRVPLAMPLSSSTPGPSPNV